MDVMDFQSGADLTEKLVKWYGGVAYDYESMPKVVAVHALTCGPNHDAGLCMSEYSQLLHYKGRKLTPFTDVSKKCFSILIGIRNKYQSMTRQSSEKPHGTSQENTNEELTHKKVQPPGLSMAKFKSSGVGDPKSTGNAPCAKDVAGMTGKGRWFLLQQGNNKSNSGSSSEKTGDALRITETPSLSLSSTSLNRTFIHLPGVEKGKKNNLNWSTLGMVAENDGTRDSNHSSPVTKKDGFHLCRENIPTSSLSDTTRRSTSTANPLIRQVINPVNLEALPNDKAEPERRPTGFLPGTKIPKCNVNLDEAVKHEGEGMESTAETRIVASERSRKRPRKSVPRKVLLKDGRVVEDENNNYYSSCSGNADEWSLGSDLDSPKESLDNTCYPSSDAASSSVVHVAEETAGEYTESNQALNGAQQIQRNYTSDYKTQLCWFTNRRIASLAHFTPSVTIGDEPGLLSSLDREARIKELLSKQEKLLTQIRREVR